MRPAGVYLLEVQLGCLNSSSIPPGPITAIFRLGRASTQITLPSPDLSDLRLTLQLNADQTALQTQRCSVTINSQDKRVLGIAVISLPKDRNELSSIYKLTQSQDKKAQLMIKTRITPFDTLFNLSNSKENSSTSIQQNSNSLKKQLSSPTIKLEPIKTLSHQENIYKNGSGQVERAQISNRYKGQSQGKTVQISQKQLKHLRQEKDVYYQLYQIQKSKNDTASSFIASLTAKLGDKYPALLASFSQAPESPSIKRKTADSQAKQTRDANAFAQLQQANRSLHRQVDQYKKITEQLKAQLSQGGPKPNINTAQENINELFPFRSNVKKNSNILSPLKEKPTFPEIDLKKWLQLSIGQRQQIQRLLSCLPKSQPELPIPNMKKARSNIDRSYATLLKKGSLSRQAIMAHKREINQIMDELAPY